MDLEQFSIALHLEVDFFYWRDGRKNFMLNRMKEREQRTAYLQQMKIRISEALNHLQYNGRV